MGNHTPQCFHMPCIIPCSWLTLFNHHTRTPGHNPFISLYITCSILIIDCSTTYAVVYPHGKQAMLYINPCSCCPRPLAPSQPPHIPQSLYLTILCLLDCPEFTGSFMLLFLLYESMFHSHRLNTLTHYIFRSAREWSLDWISRQKWRGVQRTKQDDRLATNRIICLASSRINYPLIVTEKYTTIPPSIYLLLLYFLIIHYL
jgi:hypothetical protein